MTNHDLIIGHLDGRLVVIAQMRMHIMCVFLAPDVKVRVIAVHDLSKRFLDGRLWFILQRRSKFLLQITNPLLSLPLVTPLIPFHFEPHHKE